MSEHLLRQKKNGKEHTVILDDDKDYLMTSHKWHVVDGYVRRYSHYEGRKCVFKFLHHEILPPREDFVADHKNRNKMDNRRANLRYASDSESNHNRSTFKTNRLGVKGVTFISKNPDNPYRARIMYQGVRHSGFFNCIAKATAWLQTSRDELVGPLDTETN